MTYQQLSVDLFYLAAEDSDLFNKMKDYQVRPAEHYDVLWKGLDVTVDHIWVDHDQRTVFLYICNFQTLTSLT